MHALERLVETEGAALASLRGNLLGPPLLHPGYLSLTPQVAYVNRIGGRRYGQGGGFRAKRIVEEVIEATGAPDNLRSGVIAHRQEPAKDLTVLVGKLDTTLV